MQCQNRHSDIRWRFWLFITFKTSNANGITLNGNYRTNNQTLNINCGTYNISGSYPDNYEFSSWSATVGSFGDTTTAATTYRVVEPATITLTGKESKIYMWNATSAQCGKTLYDNRDGTERAYTTKLVNNLCWMTTNLALGKGTETQLSYTDTNLAANTTYTLPASSASGFSSDAAQSIYNAGFKSCLSSQPCYGYYTYAAATAGTNPQYGAASYDICSANWRLPTQAELGALASSYGTGSSLVSNWSAVYAGNYYLSSFSGNGTAGRYWSSTAGDAYNAYYLDFNDSNAGMYYLYKGYGFSIRCVSKS